MDKDAITTLIVNELRKNRHPDEISRMLCEQGLLQWNEAEALVRQIKRCYAHQITRKRLPLNLLFLMVQCSFGLVLILLGSDLFFSDAALPETPAPDPLIEPLGAIKHAIASWDEQSIWDEYLETLIMSREHRRMSMRDSAWSNPEVARTIIVLMLVGSGGFMIIRALWSVGDMLKTLFKPARKKYSSPTAPR